MIFFYSQEGGIYVTCTMPSIEVGTVGGGTSLEAQKSLLQILLRNRENPSYDTASELLSRVVCSTVMGGELSLLAALNNGELVKSHMKLNRQQEVARKVDNIVNHNIL